MTIAVNDSLGCGAREEGRGFNLCTPWLSRPVCLRGRSEALSRASAFLYYVELGVEEEYACVGRGVAGQLATVVLVARRRPDVYKKKGAPRVAVQAAGGLVVGKRIWRCLSRGPPWWGKRLLASRC